MRDKTIKFALLTAVVLFFAGCCDKPVPPKPPGPVDDDPKVFMMYDNIDDSSSRPFSKNVADAGEAVAKGALIEGQRVIVYHRQSSGNLIYELVKDDSNRDGFSKKLLKKYAAGEMSSLSSETIHSVVGDMRTLAPANHYGLAFGSHGTGWLPKTYRTLPVLRSAVPQDNQFFRLWEERENPMTRFLAGYGEKLEVTEFAEALDDWDWDFIILDDCFMASVEALYEIRHLANHFIASPTEIMMAGFPYDRVVSAVFSDWNDLGAVGAGFVEAYRKGEISAGDPYATVAVVKSSELEGLASVMRELVHDASWNADLNPTSTSPGVQGYEGLDKHIFYDMDDYVRRATLNLPLYDEFEDRLAAAVVFADHTDRFFSDFPSGRAHQITHYCGLSVFIPWEGTAPLMPAYRNTAWYKAVYE